MSTAFTMKKRNVTTKIDPRVQYIGKRRMTASRLIAEMWQRVHRNGVSAISARINRTGDGAFVILYRGQRHLVVNLRAAEVVLRHICVRAAA